MNKNLGMVEKVVIGLTKSLEKKGYVIYTDNFYKPCPCGFFVIMTNLSVWYYSYISKRLPKAFERHLFKQQHKVGG